MKKLAILVLMLLTKTVSADVGLFFDDTARFAKTGIIQSEFPDVPLYKCRSFIGCENAAATHARIGVFFSDFKKMEKEVRSRSGFITDFRQISTFRGTGYVITTFEAVDMDGREYLLVGIKTKPVGRRMMRDVNKAVAQALVNEIYMAYQRSAVGGNVQDPGYNYEVVDG